MREFSYPVTYNVDTCMYLLYMYIYSVCVLVHCTYTPSYENGVLCYGEISKNLVSVNDFKTGEQSTRFMLHITALRTLKRGV
jgi:hypothetical protein